MGLTTNQSPLNTVKKTAEELSPVTRLSQN
jgi:hypothetical protein